MNFIETVREDPELMVRILLLIAVIVAGLVGGPILDRRAAEKLSEEE